MRAKINQDTSALMMSCAAICYAVVLLAPGAWARAAVAPSPPPSPALAQNFGDVVVQTGSSFALVGGVGFVFSAAGAVVKRKSTPLAIGVQTAQRWGRISAGFTGGQAAGQVVRKANDRWCSMAGAFFGGLAAATSLAEAPSSIATFMAFSYRLDSFGSPQSGGQQGAEASGDKIAWKGRTIEEIRAEAEARAKADYAKRHKNDKTRLSALR